jgi:hypothetical protein
MGNVERWPAKKVNEKGGDGRLTCHPPWRKLNEMRDKLVEMQGRISEPGREMAKFTTSSGMLSTMLLRAQTNSSFAIHADELLNNRPLPFSPTKYTRGLSSGDLRRCKSVSPPLIPPSAIRAEQPQSCCHTQLEMDSAPRSALPPRSRIHPRTVSRTPVARRVWPVPTLLEGEAE